MQTIRLQFSRDHTQIIKGFAILFMIVLHVFGGDGWYDADLPMNHNENLIAFMGTFKICVGMFVFMVGYGYAFSKKKDFWYSVNHVKRLLTTFWIVLLCFALPVGYNAVGGGKLLIYNMIGINSSLCWVSWFVYFYIWAMIVMPFCSRLIDRKPILWTSILMIAVYIGMVAVHHFIPNFSTNDWTQALFDCLLNTPLMLLGYLFAIKHWFEKISLPNHWFLVCGAVIIAGIVLIARALIPGPSEVVLRLLYAPLMVLSILVIFNKCEVSFFKKIMIELGNKSVYMWFFHALFFTECTRYFYQRSIMISNNLWIIAIWTIILSYCCSWVIMMIMNKLTTYISKIKSD